MRIGIICAIPKEIKSFDLLPNSAQKLGGKTFFKSQNTIHDLSVVECGLGKVNAALVSTLLIQEFECELLIFSGIAGGIDPEMKIGEVVIGESLIQYDYGALNDGRSEEHTSELQSQAYLVCRLLLEKKNTHTLSPDRVIETVKQS